MEKIHNFTYIIGHLKSVSHLKKGAKVEKGDLLGRMGNTGMSTGPHLHIGCVEGLHEEPFRLSEQFGIHKTITPALDQLELFIQGQMLWYNCESEIKTYPHDPSYFTEYNKHHPAYDVKPLFLGRIVPNNRKPSDFYWARSMPGEVTFSGEDPLGISRGYGIILMVAFQIKT